MLLYLFSLRACALACAHLFDSRHLAAGLTGTAVTVLSLAAGYSVHLKSLGAWVEWIRWISPLYWMSHPVIQGEFTPVAVLR